MASSIKIGIVGSEAAKFTGVTERAARRTIRRLIKNADVVISGGCHLGGIDEWAIDEAKKMKKGFIEFLPNKLTWGGGYKERNLLIAKNSDEVYCITLKEYSPHYTGMRFTHCYHCNSKDHVKSGGCWTVKEAAKLGKKTEVIAV